MHPPPLPPCGDDARPAEICQVTRDLGLANSQDLHEIANADFLVSDEIEEAQPGGICEGAKEKIEGERLFFPGHAPHYIWLDRYEQCGVLSIHTHKRMYRSP